MAAEQGAPSPQQPESGWSTRALFVFTVVALTAGALLGSRVVASPEPPTAVSAIAFSASAVRFPGYSPPAAEAPLSCSAAPLLPSAAPSPTASIAWPSAPSTPSWTPSLTPSLTATAAADFAGDSTMQGRCFVPRTASSEDDASLQELAEPLLSASAGAGTSWPELLRLLAVRPDAASMLLMTQPLPSDDAGGAGGESENADRDSQKQRLRTVHGVAWSFASQQAVYDVFTTAAEVGNAAFVLTRASVALEPLPTPSTSSSPPASGGSSSKGSSGSGSPEASLAEAADIVSWTNLSTAECALSLVFYLRRMWDPADDGPARDASEPRKYVPCDPGKMACWEIDAGMRRARVPQGAFSLP